MPPLSGRPPCWPRRKVGLAVGARALNDLREGYHRDGVGEKNHWWDIIIGHSDSRD